MMIEPSPKKSHSSKLQQTRHQFQQLLNCQICYCRANQPTLCPHCSKVYCEFCITTSLKLKSECPNCRKPIKGQLTHCSRFMNELSGIVGLIFENIEETEKCREHGISLNYFCEDCHKSACCECKMFGAHQTHLFTPISLVYETKYETIRDLLSSLKGRIIQKEEVLTEIEDELILVKSKTEGSITEIEDYTEKYRNKMSNENSSADEEYEDIEELVEEAQELRKIKETLANQLEHAKKVNCYRINEQVFGKLEELLLKHRQRYDNSKNIPVIEQAIPPFQQYRVIIDNYSKRTSEPFYSDPVTYEQSTWRLVVYLKGNTNNHFLSIFLQLLRNPDSINLYLYQIELVNPLNEKLNIAKEHHSRFNTNECWGYGKFMRIEQLQSKQFIDKASDTLTINYGIKFCNYYDLYRRRECILQQLERDIDSRTEKIAVLQGEMGRHSLEAIDFE